MALQRNKFCKISTGGMLSNHQFWSYEYTTDSLATITTALYFADIAEEGIVNQNDVFIITGSDGTSQYYASTVTSSDITLSALSSDEWADTGTHLTPTSSTRGITFPTGDIIATAGDIIATAGDIEATAGSVTAGTTVTAGTGITATTGDIDATAGAVTAGTSVSATTTVTGGTGVTATTGNVVATAGGVGMNSNVYYEATVTVTTEELLALAASPKTLVAAPGAGYYLKFLGADLVLDYNSAAYVEGTYNAAIRYTDGSGVIVSDTIETTGFLDQTADTISCAVPVKDAIVAASACVNQPLVLDNIGGGEWTTGNSPLYVTIRYEVCASGL